MSDLLQHDEYTGFKSEEERQRRTGCAFRCGNERLYRLIANANAGAAPAGSDAADPGLLFSNEEDVRQIEEAVKAAIATVVKVFCSVSDARMQECRREAAERQRENRRLRVRLAAAETELLWLRRLAGPLEGAGAADGDTRAARRLHSDPPAAERAERAEKKSAVGDDKSASRSVDQELLLEPLSRRAAESPCERTVTPVNPPARNDAARIPEVSFTEVSDQQGHGRKPKSVSRSEVHSEPERNPRLSASPGKHLHMKEEPSDFETVYVKWEVCEEHVRRQEDDPGSNRLLRKKDEPHISPVSFGTLPSPGAGPQDAADAHDASLVPSALLGRTAVTSLAQRLSNRERQKRYREKIRADPERQRIYREKDRCRYQKRRKLICELPEQTQKLRRQAWREAARRHRARKKSCLQIAQFPSLGNVESAINSTGHPES
ncbi:uncharacterized protein LOC114912556 [Scleropages formosus]|uniref:uncharacterized protein LOC114912556 n=1 Tax=Scleropages formosus TaxID=113540 RepID=UPI0010FA7BA4|nr:uncharacterized protein LOC114912556 [Scleropages formosus]